MKKLFFIALLFLCSCHTTQFFLGMSEIEFTSKNHNADLVKAAEGSSIYRCNTHNGHINKTMFYYFRDGKLVQVDEGERVPDFIIDARIHHQ